MLRSITVAGVLFASAACLSTGCLSAAYEQDFQSRLQEYKREAGGEPPPAKAPPGDAGGG